MENLGKTIQIFLPDGNPRGLKIAEVTSRTVQAFLIPRPLLGESAKHQALEGVGVYLLFGPSDAKAACYIGEAENCYSRLKDHHYGKDFWTHALVFVSKTHYFTKTHIRYFEWYAYAQAQKANRYILENIKTLNAPHVSEPVKADLHDYFETMRLLASTLGYPVFDEIHRPTMSGRVFCKGKAAEAIGEYSEEGMTVFEGSTSNLETTPTLGNWVLSLRNELIDEGVLIEDGDVLRFASDYVFNSPSAAAEVILGFSTNGWTAWKYGDGRTLKEVLRN